MVLIAKLAFSAVIAVLVLSAAAQSGLGDCKDVCKADISICGTGFLPNPARISRLAGKRCIDSRTKKERSCNCSIGRLSDVPAGTELRDCVIRLDQGMGGRGSINIKANIDNVIALGIENHRGRIFWTGAIKNSVVCVLRGQGRSKFDSVIIRDASDSSFSLIQMTRSSGSSSGGVSLQDFNRSKVRNIVSADDVQFSDVSDSVFDIIISQFDTLGTVSGSQFKGNKLGSLSVKRADMFASGIENSATNVRVSDECVTFRAQNIEVSGRISAPASCTRRGKPVFIKA